MVVILLEKLIVCWALWPATIARPAALQEQAPVRLKLLPPKPAAWLAARLKAAAWKPPAVWAKLVLARPLLRPPPPLQVLVTPCPMVFLPKWSPWSLFSWLVSSSLLHDFFLEKIQFLKKKKKLAINIIIIILKLLLHNNKV